MMSCCGFMVILSSRQHRSCSELDTNKWGLGLAQARHKIKAEVTADNTVLKELFYEATKCL